MRLILLASVAATFAIAAGCGGGESYPPPASSGGQTAQGGATGTGGSAQGGSAQGGAASGGAASGGASASVGYAKDVQPILMARCGACHGGQHIHNNLATKYSDAKVPVESLQFDECWADYTNPDGPKGPKTIGECSAILTRAGKMPAFSGCDSPTPIDPAVCATQAEKDILTAWVAGGMAP